MFSLEKVFHRTTINGEYIAFVDGFRFLAIFAVVTFHLATFYIARYPSLDFGIGFDLWPPFMSTGSRGVDIFFVLSAFILGLNTLKSTKKATLVSFYKRRFQRIYPPFLIAMCIVFVGNTWVTKQFSLGELLPSLLATLVYIKNVLSHYVSMPVLSMVTWTLEIEIQFYLVFPILKKIYVLPPLVRRSFFLLSSLLLVLTNWMFPLPFACLYHYLPLFFIGMLLSDLYNANKMGNRLHPFVTAMGSLLCFVGIFYYTPSISNHLFSTILYPVVLFLFFYFSVSSTFINQLLSVKVVSLIGGMCYSIYLVHTSIISLLERYIGDKHIMGESMADMLLWLLLNGVLVLGTSSLFFLCVEKPFMRSKKN